MDYYLKSIGFLAICFAIVFIYHKILEYYDLKRLGFFENEKVYQAADAFAHRASSEEVKTLLESCNDFDVQNADKTLTWAIPHRTDKDGGYQAFIKAVNKVLGDDIYNERHHPAKVQDEINTPHSDIGVFAFPTITPLPDNNRRLSK